MLGHDEPRRAARVESIRIVTSSRERERGWPKTPLPISSGFQISDAHNRNGIAVIDDVFLGPLVASPGVVLLAG